MEENGSRNGKRAGSQETVHLGLLIDETGSMTGNEPAVIGGLNEFIESLRADEAEANVRVTMSMFDLHGNDPVVRAKFKGIPLEEVTPLGPGDYQPRGATPLNDAVVKTIRSMARVVKKGHRAMLVILTDGLENASETPSRDVRKLIHRKEKAGWEFIYLGANQDVWAEAEKVGLAQPGKSLRWEASPEGTDHALRLSADRAKSFRDDPERYKAEAEELGDDVEDR
ncbi:MAG: vWA domain-containing protein [Solirubrobacterales bacterium]